MNNTMKKIFLIEMLHQLTEAANYINPGDQDDIIEFSKQLTGLGFTMYLTAKTDKKLTREEEILIAQSFNNQMLRGLYDLIDIREENLDEIVNDILRTVHVCSCKSKKPGGK